MREQHNRPHAEQRQRRSSRSVKTPEPITLGKNTSINVLYEDQQLLAIDKPAGWLVTTPKWSHTKQNLQREIEIAIQVRDHWVKRRQLKFLRFVHRLDRETSGVLLLAKNRTVLTNVSQDFAEQRVEKLYLCQVHGIPAMEEWQCDAPIAKGSKDQPQVKIDRRGGLPASTLFRVLAKAQNTALVLAAPKTGRTHQIRIHLSAAGHPIVGDSLYAPQEKDLTRQLALRAWALALPATRHRNPVLIEAPSRSFAKHVSSEVRLPTADQAFKDIYRASQSEDLLVTRTGRLSKATGA